MMTFKEYLVQIEGLDWNQFNNTNDNRQRRIRKRWKQYQQELIVEALEEDKKRLLCGQSFFDRDRVVLGLIAIGDVKLVSSFKAVCGKCLRKEFWGIRRKKRRVLFNVVFSVMKDDVIFPCYIEHLCVDECYLPGTIGTGSYIEFDASICRYSSFSGNNRYGLDYLRNIRKISPYNIPFLQDYKLLC